uniref:Transferred entry: 7.1.1.9 n=1 Tax=Parastrongyloides trichosuri TaxID=131310 RepID=A0A0N5A118_PARTI
HRAVAADSVERGGHHLAGVRPHRHRPAGRHVVLAGRGLQLHRERRGRLGHRAGDGRLALDAAGGPAVLRGPARHSRRLLPGRAHRRRVAHGGVPVHPAAQDAGRAHDRGAAALHGQLHDLHRALRADGRRAGQRHHLPVAVPDAEGRGPVRPGAGCRVLHHLLPDHPALVLHPVQLDAARRHDRRLRRGARKCVTTTPGGAAPS